MGKTSAACVNTIKLTKLLFLVSLFFLLACQNQNTTQNTVKQQFTFEDSLINRAIENYGMESLQGNKIEFDFRAIHYEAKFLQNGFEYRRTQVSENGDTIVDVLTHEGLQRYIQNEKVITDSLKTRAYANSINSVMYFTFLPKRLTDEAAILKSLGTQNFNNKTFELIEVTFLQEYGGEDFDDQYVYWFNQQNLKMEFLAYKYHTNNGGIRFRILHSDNIVEGITFQNYYNLKPADLSTPLTQLPNLWQNNALDTVSVIINKNFKVSRL